MDLGECSKIHDLALRADYEIASKERDLFFELDVSMVNIVTIITVLCMVNPFVVLRKLVEAITITAVISIRLWITWSHSSQTVTAGLNWPRRDWQRHRRRSVPRELPR